MGATSPHNVASAAKHTPDFPSQAELRLIADFIDAEYSEENAPDHPSSTLRRYADRLRAIADDWPQPRKGSPTQAEVAWVVEDILDKYHCLPDEAFEFLEEYEEDIQLAMIETGWCIIRDNCGFASRDED